MTELFKFCFFIYILILQNVWMHYRFYGTEKYMTQRVRYIRKITKYDLKLISFSWYGHEFSVLILLTVLMAIR